MRRWFVALAVVGCGPDVDGDEELTEIVIPMQPQSEALLDVTVEVAEDALGVVERGLVLAGVVDETGRRPIGERLRPQEVAAAHVDGIERTAVVRVEQFR